jgi:hypothetical protein
MGVLLHVRSRGSFQIGVCRDEKKVDWFWPLVFLSHAFVGLFIDEDSRRTITLDEGMMATWCLLCRVKAIIMFVT